MENHFPIEAVRFLTMLHHHASPKQLWAGAAKASVAAQPVSVLGPGKKIEWELTKTHLN